MPRFNIIPFKDLDTTELSAAALHRRLWQLRDALMRLGRELGPLQNRAEVLTKHRNHYLRLISKGEQDLACRPAEFVVVAGHDRARLHDDARRATARRYCELHRTAGSAVAAAYARSCGYHPRTVRGWAARLLQQPSLQLVS